MNKKAVSFETAKTFVTLWFSCAPDGNFLFSCDAHCKYFQTQVENTCAKQGKKGNVGDNKNFGVMRKLKKAYEVWAQVGKHLRQTGAPPYTNLFFRNGILWCRVICNLEGVIRREVVGQKIRPTTAETYWGMDTGGKHCAKRGILYLSVMPTINVSKAFQSFKVTAE